MGHPFYAAGVAYRQNYDLSRPDGRYKVALNSWLGSVAEVKVNGKRAGWITAPPFECDITRQLRKGENALEVVVIGTLKNTLGPHHENRAPGSAWPSQFQKGPETGPPAGDRYYTLPYGLFEPFQLKHLLPDSNAANLTSAAGK
jgi:hypothetical protein